MLINGPGSIGKPHGKKILSPTLHLIQKSILDDLFLEENIGEYLVASEQAKSLFFSNETQRARTIWEKIQKLNYMKY